MGYPDLLFQEDTLKNCLRDTLKGLKAETNNEAHGDMAAVQSDEKLVRLETTDGTLLTMCLSATMTSLTGALPHNWHHPLPWTKVQHQSVQCLMLCRLPFI